MIEIPLTQGHAALIDDEDAGVARHKWYARKIRNVFYAMRNVRRRDGTKTTVGLHREILGINDPRIQVDHRDGNGLNCRRQNLRKATSTQNQQNRRLGRDNTSGFKGVHWNRSNKGWSAGLKVDGRRYYLGTFSSSLDAALAYDAAARKFHGEFATVNFPCPGERAA